MRQQSAAFMGTEHTLAGRRDGFVAEAVASRGDRCVREAFTHRLGAPVIQMRRKG
jgi:hypothetical protein